MCDVCDVIYRFYDLTVGVNFLHEPVLVGQQIVSLREGVQSPCNHFVDLFVLEETGIVCKWLWMKGKG